MAKPKLVAAADADGAEPERSKVRRHMDMTAVAMQATYEIEQLAALLSQPEMDQRAETFVYIARGLGRRIHALNNILMSYIGDTDLDERDVRQFEQELYG